jgi:hypothetical protein
MLRYYSIDGERGCAAREDAMPAPGRSAQGAEARAVVPAEDNRRADAAMNVHFRNGHVLI